MKHNSKITALILIIMTTFFVTTWYGCQKNNDFVSTNTASDNIAANQSMQKALNAIRATYGNVSGGDVYNINVKADKLTYFDNKGNKVALPENTTTSEPTVYLNTAVRTYICENTQQSNLVIYWLFTSPYPPLVSFNGNNSNGTAVITSPSGATLTQTANTIKIQKLGVASGADTNYFVSYTITNIANSFFGANMNISASLNLYYQGPNLSNLISTGFVNPIPKTYGNTTRPCTRIDKLWVTAGTGTGGAANAFGNYTLCTPPSGLDLIDKHQVEYRKVVNPNSLEWFAQDNQALPSLIYWGSKISSGIRQSTTNALSNTDALIFPETTTGSGTWIVRYRNLKTGSCEIINNTNPTYNAGSPTPQAGGDWGSSQFWTQEVF